MKINNIHSALFVVRGGAQFFYTLKQVYEISKANKVDCEFEFNGYKLFVSPKLTFDNHLRCAYHAMGYYEKYAFSKRWLNSIETVRKKCEKLDVKYPCIKEDTKNETIDALKLIDVNLIKYTRTDFSIKENRTAAKSFLKQTKELISDIQETIIDIQDSVRFCETNQKNKKEK